MGSFLLPVFSQETGSDTSADEDFSEEELLMEGEGLVVEDESEKQKEKSGVSVVLNKK